MTDNFIGIQIGPVSFIDEGVETVLDTLQEKAGVNALVSGVVACTLDVSEDATGSGLCRTRNS